MEKDLKNEIDITGKNKADAQILWDYQASEIYEEPQKSDFIIVTGHDIRLVDAAVDLYKQGYASLFIASGGHKYGEIRKLKADGEDPTEAEVYKQRAIELGVPEGAIIVQDKSKNAGEVFKYLREIFKAKGIKVKRGIFVYQPDKQRRGKATLEKQWPELETIVTSLKTMMKNYVNEELPMKELIKQMVGNFKRILEYPALGFQTKQEISEEVLDAYERLVAAGFGD